jgi:phage terminase large subunit
MVNLGNIIVDEDGVGGGLKDILRCKGFTNNARALKGENYSNMKTQVYYKMASMMNKGQVSLSSAKDIELKNTIIQELEQVKRTKIDSDAKLSMISKDKVKEMLGRSPDYSDAIAMRFYYEIRSNVGRYSLI